MEGKASTPLKIMLPFSNSKIKYNTKTLSRPLNQLIVENTIKEENLQYQQLLIRTKELQIKMGELQVQLEALQKKRKKQDRLAEQARERKEKVIIELKQKQCYLQRYYQELDKKFRGGREDLFSGLKKLEQNLVQMYQRDEKRIRESLNSQREELVREDQHVSSQRLQRDLLRQELYTLQKEKEVQHHDQFHNEKQQLIAENQFVRSEIERLVREKKSLQTQQKIMKRILNIEEQHRKHCSLIAAGIRRLFAMKLKEQRYKEAVAQDYTRNITGLRDIIGRRKKQKDMVAIELEDKKAKLDLLRQQNDAKSRQYGQLEDQLFKLERHT